MWDSVLVNVELNQATEVLYFTAHHFLVVIYNKNTVNCTS